MLRPLHSLTYTSTALHSPSAAELEHILSGSQRRNAAAGITGVLLYSGGIFMQCLEGPPDAVEEIFARIKADPLHHEVFELANEPIEAREFAEWRMMYGATIGGRLNVVSPSDDLLSARLTLPPGDLSVARHLLSAFWNNGHGALSSSLVDNR